MWLIKLQRTEGRPAPHAEMPASRTMTTSLAAPAPAVPPIKQRARSSSNVAPRRSLGRSALKHRCSGRTATSWKPPGSSPVRLGVPAGATGGSKGQAEERVFLLEPIGDGSCFHLQKDYQHAGSLRFPADEDIRVVIGRKGGNGDVDIEVDVGSLSSRHAEILVSRGRLFVRDLGSTNGTRVNGRYLSAGEEARLRPGQVLVLGDEHLAAFKVTGPADQGGGLFDAISNAMSQRQVATAPRKQPSTEAQQAAEVPGARQAAGEMQAGRVSAVVGSQPLPGAAPQAAIETVEGVAAAAWQQDSLSCDSEELAEGEIETLAEGMAAYGAGVESGSAALSPRVPTATNSSVAVTSAGSSRQMEMRAEGRAAERSGPLGALGGLADVTGRLGAMITNSNVQVNYQYKPVVQFNTGGKPLGPAEIKSALLVAIAGKSRGLKASEKDVMKVEQLARSLEAQNPTPSPLKSPLLNGRWALQYTTCKSILRRGPAALLRPNGPIYQTVDIFNLKMLNEEQYEPLPFIKWTSSSSSNLDAKSNSRAEVKPDQFRVGPFKVNAPPASPARAALSWEASAMGSSTAAWMETTYLDADLRVSRNSNGDMFVFTRDDPNDS